MKKKGSRCKKFKNLENDLLIVINSSKKIRTINDIRRNLEKKEIKTSWNTTRNYLESLHRKKKIIKITFGKNIKFLFWGQK